MKWELIGAVVAISGSTASAGGFYVPEIGGRATAMGAAVVADGDDPSAVFHDPANLVRTEGFQIEVAADLVLPSVTFFRRPLTDPNTGQYIHFDGASNTNSVVVVPYIGASYRLSPRVAVGLAVDAPFGASLDFPTDGAQRQLVTSIALRTISISPAVAVEVAPGLAVGVSANVIYSDLVLDQRNAMPYVTGDPEYYPDPQGELQGTTHLAASDPFSLGATIGVNYRSPGNALRIGASVMTPVNLHMEGDARVANPSISGLFDDNNQQLQPPGVRTDQIKVAIPLPLVARLGVAAQLAAHVRGEVDVNWTRWSSFQSLDIDFVHEYYLLQTPGANLYDVHVANNWHNSWTARVGVEAQPFERPIALRAGLVYDQSPIDDRHFSVMTPDSDKLGITAGARWTQSVGTHRFDFQLAVAHLFLRDRDIAPTASGAPGSDGTILNKPAPSFFYGVTRAGISILTLAVAWR
ncbi:MAG: outer membrane protein transport protein [Kofleriaceae bacterium]